MTVGLLYFYIAYAPVDLSSVVIGKKSRRNCKICSKRTTVVVDRLHEICLHKDMKRKDLVLKNVDNTMNFKFLTDLRTVRHIKNSHIMFILRGLPGSGKSTIVRNIQAVYPDSVTCSADDHFLIKGSYKFDVSGLKDAHAECQQKARLSCESRIPVIIIDNTNVRHWEMKYYFSLARHANYIVVTAETRTPWRFRPEELAKRNKHGVEEEILRAKVTQFENPSPVYYGWFLTEKGSKDVRFIAHVLFRECMKNFHDFNQLLKNTCDAVIRTRDGHMNDEHGVETMANYFKFDKSGLLHCTAKFCNKGRAPGAYEYQHRLDVQEAVGKASVLQVVGFSFSRDAVGARIQLSDEQLPLFDKPEERGRDDILARNAAVKSRVAQMNRSCYKAEPLMKDVNTLDGGSSFPGRSMVSKSPSSSSISQTVVPPPHGFGRSAHITVCCAEGVKPSQTIYDLLDICDTESLYSESFNFIPVMGGMAAYIDDGFCAVYLYKPVTVSSLFSAYHV